MPMPMPMPMPLNEIPPAARWTPHSEEALHQDDRHHVRRLNTEHVDGKVVVALRGRRHSRARRLSEVAIGEASDDADANRDIKRGGLSRTG